ncbi:sugar-binding transcriptional regulator [Martelella endophytica]|uniref:Transcriptional regulator n=1 Tax=Martelella endophytica TaxID=1486262 RepID=A0A0D5LP94_MAREN|nr:sugar-binding domain-containing protein [Martelella endophytica]AJY45936.1 transcriptional regulator [Martelella endophytica]
MTASNDDPDVFLTEVCWHYFVNGLTQSEVATRLGVTRLRVNQAIKEARAKGFVRVEIQSPHVARLDMQAELVARYGLDEAIVAPADPVHHDYHRPAGAALAFHLASGLAAARWQTIGVSWGMTLNSAIQQLPRMERPSLEIVSMIGGMSQGAAFNSFGIASGFADRLGARYSLFAAPIYLSRGADTEAFLSDTVFRQHLDKLEALDLAVLVAGDLSERSFLMTYGVPSDVSAADLAAAGAVGDILGHFIDARGREVDHPLNRTVIGMSLPALEKVPERILAAAGNHKVDVIVAALKRGLVTTLITDDVTAECILKREP